jgi:hypothetical protein
LNCGHVKDNKNFVSWKKNSDAAFGKISRISTVSVFIGASRNLNVTFLTIMLKKRKFKTIGAHEFIGFQQKYSSHDIVPLNIIAY